MTRPGPHIRWQWLLAAGLISTLAACSKGASSERSAASPGPSGACENVQYKGSPLSHCSAKPGVNRITTALAARDGRRYRSLSQLALALGAANDHAKPDQAPQIAFATNGGRFDAKGAPLGYYAQNSKRLHALARSSADSVFGPDGGGVFFGPANGPWAIRTAQDFFSHVDRRPDFGTQSGPMLVVNGHLTREAQGDEGNTDKRIRAAVGVGGDGSAQFVIADAPVSRGLLAHYFLDALHCRDAMVLDGAVSSLWDPEHGRVDGGPALGPLIVVEKRRKAKS